MGILIYSPSWFTGVDIALEMVSVAVSFLLFFLAFKLYKISNEKNFLRFSFGFFAISASYVIKILSDIYLYTNINTTTRPWINLIMYRLSTIEFVNIFGNLAHRFLLLLGFLILLVVYLRIKDKRVIFLLSYFVFIISAFSAWSFLLFQTTMAMVAGTVGIHVLMKFIESRKKAMLRSTIAFGLLFAAQACFMFTFFLERQMFVIGHILQASGFLVLLLTYFMVLKK
jgi:hypothetical protein